MSEMFFIPTGLLIGLKAFTDISTHNERATEGDWEGGWGSVECGPMGGGCDPHGSVDNTGVASSLTVTSYSSSKTEEDFQSVGTAAGEAVRVGAGPPNRTMSHSLPSDSSYERLALERRDSS